MSKSYSKSKSGTFYGSPCRHVFLHSRLVYWNTLPWTFDWQKTVNDSAQFNKKLRYRSQTVRRCSLTAINWSDLSTFTLFSSTLRPRWGRCPRAIRFMFGMGKLEWLGYNLVKVAWWSTQSFGHNTSTWQTHTDRQTDRHRHVAMANAAPTHYIGRQKRPKSPHCAVWRPALS